LLQNAIGNSLGRRRGAQIRAAMVSKEAARNKFQLLSHPTTPPPTNLKKANKLQRERD